MQAIASICVAQQHVSSSSENQLKGHNLTILCSKDQGRVAISVLTVDIHKILITQQRDDHLNAALGRCHVEAVPSIFVHRVDMGRGARLRRQHTLSQGRLRGRTILLLDQPHSRLPLQNLLHGLDVPKLTRNDQSGIFVDIERVDVETLYRQQGGKHASAALGSSGMEAGFLVLVLEPRIGSEAQQNARGQGVPVGRRDHQRGAPAAVSGIHFHVRVTRKMPQHFFVVVRSRMMQWRPELTDAGDLVSCVSGIHELLGRGNFGGGNFSQLLLVAGVHGLCQQFLNQCGVAPRSSDAQAVLALLVLHAHGCAILQQLVDSFFGFVIACDYERRVPVCILCVLVNSGLREEEG
ncbi:hypothetical protein Mapa_012570 [Marchantia paleacea]|nr:hypothetical protein Mapa_012570 [Marchantia paleacea]